MVRHSHYVQDAVRFCFLYKIKLKHKQKIKNKNEVTTSKLQYTVACVDTKIRTL